MIPPSPPNTGLAEAIRARTGENVFACYQCAKCSSGCPLAGHLDLAPSQVMRAAQLGLDEIALGAKTPWLCAGCATCTTRCPNGIDVARVMDVVMDEARARGIAGVPEVERFHDVFLRNARRLGRSYELGLVAELNLRNGTPGKDLGLGLALIRKGRMKLLPEFARPPRHPRPVGKRPNQIAYYPGCSLHSVAADYDRSVQAVAAALALDLVEPDGWVCCGATPAKRRDPLMAVERPMANLALVEQIGLDQVTSPCAACFGHFKAAQHAVARDPALKAEVETRIGHAAQGEIAVRSLVEVMVDMLGLDVVAARVSRPLEGLKVACYYGCLLTRPPAVTGAEDAEYPMQMDRLVGALGATALAWGGKTACCGASLSLSRSEIVLDLSSRIMADARAAGADVVAVACPMCHANLDGRQPQMAADAGAGAGRAIPVLYFTQLMAIAFGLGEKPAALAGNMVDPRPLLADKGLLG